MKALLNDGMDEEGIQLFEKNGIKTDAKKRDLSTLIREIPEFDALGVRSATKVTREVIESGAKGNLKIVGRAGVGVDNIDIDAAIKNGIVVKYAPKGNTNSTAELAHTLMLAVARKIPQAHYALKNGYWIRKSFQGTELSHKTLGIIGCGRIGQRLSELVRGYDMYVIGYDMKLEKVKILFPNSRIGYHSKEEVLSQADFVSIHTGGSEVVIGEKEISMMKSTAYLINSARGQHVDEKALYDALKTRRIAGAGLDTYIEEPETDAMDKPNFGSIFRDLDNVVMSSHLGASTPEAQKQTSIEIAHAVIDYLLKGDFSNAVNVGETIELEQRPVYPLFIHHRDVPGAFATIDKSLAEHNINIRENPSRQLGKDGSVITVYLVHQKTEQHVIDELNALKGIVYRANI